MIYVLLLIVLVIVLILLKNKKIILNLKSFFKRYKVLIVLELLIIISATIFIIFNNTIKIVEKDPHSNKVLKSANLKVGERYTYKTMYFEKTEEPNSVSDLTNIMSNYKEKQNVIKIENIGITKVKISINEIQKEYKYGTGFSYYGIASCSCGTPIIFEIPGVNIIKILAFSMIIIDLLIVILIKDKKEVEKI